MRALDVPADKVRHPAVFGPLGRSRPLAVHEIEFLQTLTDRPVKVALPGPYLLTRTMWMECISRRTPTARASSWPSDIVRVLREELHFLLAAGVALVQLDEPVLAEVVFTGPKRTRTFMCGALSEKGEPRRRARVRPRSHQPGRRGDAARAPRPARVPGQLDAGRVGRR